MRQTVAQWRSRFIRQGLASIEKDAPRPGRKPQISAKRVRQIVRMTTRDKPSKATHWSTRSMSGAKTPTAFGLSLLQLSLAASLRHQKFRFGLIL
ncbi:MAG: helix-turn-helix domain-containing protein [Pyrinomonadaceae bacterium]